MTDDGFNPSWASPPGDTITDVLRERGDEFAEALKRCLTELHYNLDDLLSGKLAINIYCARVLSQRIGGTPEFWMMRDYQYRNQCAKLGIEPGSAER